MLKIKDFEDYLIDENGKVYSIRKNKWLKTHINKYGYEKVVLQKNKFRKTLSVHRLVAIAFIPNPNNYPQVNHIDGEKTNNNVSNLEWCTPKHNMNEAVRIGLFESVKKKNRENAIKNKLYKYHVLANEKTKKKVNQYDKQNNLLNTFESISEASRKTNVKIVAISYACNGKRKTGGGYIWHFA